MKMKMKVMIMSENVMDVILSSSSPGRFTPSESR